MTMANTLAPLTGWIDGIGLIGPGLPDWETGRRMLAGTLDYRPTPTTVTLPPILPAAERRRTSLAVRIALASGHQAVAASSFAAEHLHSVFSSSGGDGVTCHLICAALAEADRRVSPTHFHNSVHNAPSGYWGIAMRATASSTSLCAYDASFGAGLLEAFAQLAARRAPVLLVAYDAPYPDPLHRCRPVADAFAVALVLAPAPATAASRRLSLALGPGTATGIGTPVLETMRRTIPTARALPLLQRLARETAGDVVLDYLDAAPTASRILLRVD